MATRAGFQTLATKFLTDTFLDFAKTISIIQEIEASDSQGGTSTTRSTFATTTCFVFPMAGKENVEAGGLYSKQMFKFSMKPVSGLTNKMIISYTNNDSVTNDYKIESISDTVEVNAWINVIAEKDE